MPCRAMPGPAEPRLTGPCRAMSALNESSGGSRSSQRCCRSPCRAGLNRARSRPASPRPAWPRRIHPVRMAGNPEGLRAIVWPLACHAAPEPSVPWLASACSAAPHLPSDESSREGRSPPCCCRSCCPAWPRCALPRQARPSSAWPSHASPHWGLHRHRMPSGSGRNLSQLPVQLLNHRHHLSLKPAMLRPPVAQAHQLPGI